MVTELNLVGDEVEWWLDTGVTRHICNDRNMFKSYEVVSGMNMYMKNSASSSVSGK